MRPGDENRFQDFFEEDKYVVLKNHLYNYQLRKHAVERILAREPFDLILEVGSGISPVMTRTDRIVYSEISFLACRTSKRLHGMGWCVVADATRLPFCPGAFSHAISAEVLEHVEDDRAALRELARVLKQNGRLILTFPHRKAYFANDDRYVEHHRRYELEEITRLLDDVQLHVLSTQKVLGPLEKATMMLAVLCFEAILKRTGAASSQHRDHAAALQQPSTALRWLAPLFKWANLAYAALLWFEARIVPQRWAAVLLTIAGKR